ncbi:MAG TPA: hypothetical protein VFT64_12115 [Rickettsiales bacterium]|nr:hypothetical protein [Rickettsiales bacterium]
MPTPEELNKMGKAAIEAVDQGTHDHRDVVKAMTDVWTAVLTGQVPVEPSSEDETGGESSPSS